MGLISLIKIKALVNFIDSVEASKIVDMLEDFAKKYFGNEWKESLNALRTKLANVVFEIGRRIK